MDKNIFSLLKGFDFKILKNRDIYLMNDIKRA